MVYNEADPWFTMQQINGLQCGKSMIYNVADLLLTLTCRSIVYNAADPWFTMWQIHGLQCGRSMVYNAADP
jgi:hypothetical protein